MHRFCLQTRNARRAGAVRPAVVSLAGVLLAGALLTAGPSHGLAADDTVRVTIQPTTTALPMVVADKKGMFAKHGIVGKWTVSHVPISDSISTLGRQFDVMMGTQPALIAAVGQGIPVVVITGGALDTAKVPTSNIIADAKSGITSFKQLQGKTVGTLTLTGNIHFSLLNVLEKEKVDLKSIHWVIGTVPQLPDLLKAGRVDAIEEIEPFASAAIAAGGVSLGDPFRSISDRAYIGIWLSQQKWANDNRDLVLRFAQSLNDAATWIASHSDEAKTILGSYTGLQGPALEKTPIPEFQFATSAASVASQLRPDMDTWIDILKRTSDLKPVKADQLLPDWAK